jgi:L-lactate dehydrogenase complex protein LldE
VALFVTCMVDTLYPDIGMAAVRLLEAQGADVVFPDAQTCCGQPAFNAGYRHEARTMARNFIDVFWPLVDNSEVDAVVAPGGSCVAMLRNLFPVLFEDDHEYRRRALQVAEVAFELSEYLVDVLGVDEVAARFNGKLTYHPCCHLLRELHVDSQPRRLLAGLQDAEIVDLPGADECCGFGGLFAIKNAPISTAMGTRKVRNIEASAADVVAVNDVSCMTHLNGILQRQGHRCRAVHIAELLASGLDGNGADEREHDDR